MHQLLRSGFRLLFWSLFISLLLAQCKKTDDTPVTPTPPVSGQDPVKPGVNVGFGGQPLTRAEYEKLPLLPDPLAGGRLAAGLKDPTLPAAYDLSVKMPPVGNQETQGSCTAWSVAYAARSYFNASAKTVNYTGADGKRNDDAVFSPTFVYNQAKEPGDCQTKGIPINRALDLLKTSGVCTLRDMPYNTSDCSAQPTAEQKQKAENYKIKNWGRINITTSTLRKYLYFDYPIIVCAALSEGFLTLADKDASGEYVWKTFSPNSTYHAMVIVGYDDSRKAFKLQNSWSDRWANKGFIWLSYDILDKAVLEAYVMVAGETNPNVKPPTLKTEAAGAVVNGEITLKGLITDLGDLPLLKYGFCVSTTQPLPTQQTEIQNSPIASTPHSFSAKVQATQTRMYYRAFAETTTGIVYSDTMSVLAKAGTPAATGGYLVLQDQGAYAYDAGNGSLLWQYKLPRDQYTFGDGGTYVGNSFYMYSDKSVFALNLTNGLLKWQFTPPTGTLPYPNIYPVATTDIVVVPAGDKLFGVIAATGVQKWEYQAPYAINQLTVANNLVFVGSSTANTMYAIDITTGKLTQTYNNARCIANPVVSNGKLYVPSLAALRTFGVATGSQEWEFKGNRFGPPTVYGNTVYLTDTEAQGDTRLYALDVATGAKRWEYLPTDSKNANYDLSVDNNLICLSIKYYSNTGKGTLFQVLDASLGSQKWNKKFDVIPNLQEDVVSTPVIADKLLYVSFYNNATYSRGIAAYDATTGAESWKRIDANNSTVRTFCVQNSAGKTYYRPQSGMQQ